MGAHLLRRRTDRRFHLCAFCSVVRAGCAGNRRQQHARREHGLPLSFRALPPAPDHARLRALQLFDQAVLSTALPHGDRDQVPVRPAHLRRHRSIYRAECRAGQAPAMADRHGDLRADRHRHLRSPAVDAVLSMAQIAVPSGYEALRNGAVWLDLSARGKIKATGEDRARLLHAMTTNHVESLAPGTGCYAYFLSAQGRILADVNLLCRTDHFLLDTEPETREKLFSHLDSFVIADDVTLEDVTPTLATVALEGPEAG